VYAFLLGNALAFLQCVALISLNAHASYFIEYLFEEPLFMLIYPYSIHVESSITYCLCIAKDPAAVKYTQCGKTFYI
jgi:hypothetical protein